MVPKADPDSDRRRSRRAPSSIQVDYSSVDAFFTEFASDINEGGMFIETDSPPEPTSVVALQVQLPGLEEPLQVQARVIWTSDGKDGTSAPGMGVEFLDLHGEALETINSVVRNLRAR